MSFADDLREKSKLKSHIELENTIKDHENLTQNCEWIYSNFCQKCENSANKGKRTAKYIEVITYRPLSQTYSDKKYFTCLTQILTEKLAICDFLSFSVDIQNNGCLCIKAEW